MGHCLVRRRSTDLCVLARRLYRLSPPPDPPQHTHDMEPRSLLNRTSWPIVGCGDPKESQCADPFVTHAPTLWTPTFIWDLELALLAARAVRHSTPIVSCHAVVGLETNRRCLGIPLSPAPILTLLLLRPRWTSSLIISLQTLASLIISSTLLIPETLQAPHGGHSSLQSSFLRLHADATETHHFYEPRLPRSALPILPRLATVDVRSLHTGSLHAPLPSWEAATNVVFFKPAASLSCSTRRLAALVRRASRMTKARLTLEGVRILT
ncbi:hypothetical protein B0H12DRAFT_476536 [Mycena haematopus]|nr:hypothetical protein B0H12DRAFT_476536 [Mycena haematopus]